MIIVVSFFISLTICWIILVGFILIQGESFSLAPLFATACIVFLAQCMIFYPGMEGNTDKHSKYVSKKISRRLILGLIIWNLAALPLLGLLFYLVWLFWSWGQQSNSQFVQWLVIGLCVLGFMLGVGILRSSFRRFFEKKMPTRRQYVHPP